MRNRLPEWVGVALWVLVFVCLVVLFTLPDAPLHGGFTGGYDGGQYGRQ